MERIEWPHFEQIPEEEIYILDVAVIPTSIENHYTYKFSYQKRHPDYNDIGVDNHGNQYVFKEEWIPFTNREKDYFLLSHVAKKATDKLLKEKNLPEIPEFKWQKPKMK